MKKEVFVLMLILCSSLAAALNSYMESELETRSLSIYPTDVDLLIEEVKRVDMAVKNHGAEPANFTLNYSLVNSSAPALGWIFFVENIELDPDEVKDTQILFNPKSGWEKGHYLLQLELFSNDILVDNQTMLLNVVSESSEMMLDSDDIADNETLSQSFYIILFAVLFTLFIIFYFSLKTYIH